MTTLLGFDRPTALYEFASSKGIHAGSMDKLVEFAAEIQRRGFAERDRRTLALDEMVRESERLGLYDLEEK